MRFAGFWVRCAAYTIDIVPIVLGTTAVFYVFLGFDNTWRTFTQERGNIDARIQFLVERNRIRDLSFLIWMLYCTMFEASRLQGTLGKYILGLRVVSADGSRITLTQSLGRNLAKLTSYMSLGLGFLWAAFSREKRAWHDIIARTRVIRGNGPQGV